MTEGDKHQEAEEHQEHEPDEVEATVRTVEVPTALSGSRIDAALAKVAGISRAKMAKLIGAGKAGLVGIPHTVPSHRVRGGELAYFEVQVEALGIEPAEVDFPVLYEDPWVAVISKPAGIAVHPGAGTAEPTLASGILHRWPTVERVGDASRPGIVHRLDKDTSGLMVIALESSAYESLLEAFRARRVVRKYLVLVLGRLEADRGRIEAPIGRDPSDPTRFGVVLGGKKAITNFERVATWSDKSLAVVSLETGRTHQIRVHMAAISHPVVGDVVYGGRGAAHLGSILGLERPFLHAVELALPHPRTGEEVRFEDSLPEELVRSLQRLERPEEGEASLASLLKSRTIEGQRV